MGIWNTFKKIETAPFNWLKGSNPANEANKYIEKIPGAVKPYYEPFFEAGKTAIPQLQEQYGQLLKDPGALISKIGSGYKESPGFQFALEKALAAGNRSAAAGGMAGSPANMNLNMETATGLANQDYNTYLQHALAQYGMGLQGEQNLLTGGQTAGGNMADMIAQALAQQGQIKFAGQASQNQFIPGMISAGVKALPYMGL